MKVVVILTSLVLLAMPVKAQLTGDTFEEALAQGEAEITVSFLEEDAFAFYDNGDLKGIHIEIFQSFVNWAEREYEIDITINWHRETDSFSAFYERVSDGTNGVFGLGTVTILEERKQEVQFTPPFLVNVAVLATHETAPSVNNWDEFRENLQDMQAVNRPGTTVEARIQYLRENYLPGLETVEAGSQTEAMEMINENPDLFSYIDLAVFWPLREELNLQRYEFADEPGEEFGYIMPPDSDWDEPINRFFNLGSGLQTTTLYQNVVIEYLGHEVHELLQLARRQTN